jgi:hypothetical protein
MPPSVTGEGFLADHQFITAFWGAARVMSALNLIGTRDRTEDGAKIDAVFQYMTFICIMAFILYYSVFGISTALFIYVSGCGQNRESVCY